MPTLWLITDNKPGHRSQLQGLAQAQRLPLLNQTAISQMQLLLADPSARRLEQKP